MSDLKAVLCDIDGTLIDSNDLHAKAFVQAFAEADVDATFEQVRPLIGMGGDKLIPKVSGFEKDSESFKKISERRKQIVLDQYVSGMKQTPGAEALLNELKRRGLKLVAATSGEEDTEAALKQTSLDAYFDTKATSKDADKSKPDPDILKAALDRAEVDASEALMLGDTPYDIEAANRSSLRIIAFLTGGWSREALKEANIVLESPDELLARLDEVIGTGHATDHS